MKHKFLTVLLAFVTAFCLCFGLAACGEQTPPRTPSGQEDTGGDDGSKESEGEEPPPAADPDLSFDDFLKDHKADGVTFFRKYLQPEITANAIDNYESLNFTANSADQLEGVSYAFIEKTGDTSRKFSIVSIAFSAPIEFEDIAADAESSQKTLTVTPALDRTYSLEYDAKINATKTELIDTVNGKFSGYYSSDYEKGVSRIYCETTNEESIREMVTLQINNDSTINVFLLRVKDLSGSDADMIDCLNDPISFEENHRRHINSSFALEGENILTAAYVFEEYEEEGGGEEAATPVTDINDLLTNYASEVREGLQSVKEELGKEINSHLPGYREEKLIESEWDFALDAHGNITKINFIGTHQNINTVTYFVASVTPAAPIDVTELTNKNIQEKLTAATENGALKYEYYFDYTVSEQIENQDLAKAIFEKEGILEQNATYLISSFADTTDSELHAITVGSFVQITVNGIKEITARIKDTTNVTENYGSLEENVRHGLYRKTGGKSYELGGYTLSAEEE